MVQCKKIASLPLGCWTAQCRQHKNFSPTHNVTASRGSARSHNLCILTISKHVPVEENGLLVFMLFAELAVSPDVAMSGGWRMASGIVNHQHNYATIQYGWPTECPIHSWWASESVTYRQRMDRNGSISHTDHQGLLSEGPLNPDLIRIGCRKDSHRVITKHSVQGCWRANWHIYAWHGKAQL